MELFYGRPLSLDDRLEKERMVYDFLDSLSIQYHRVDHLPADTMEACEKINSVLGAKICKNLFLCNRQKTAYYLLLMPASKPFKTKELSAQINSARLSFASADDLQQYLGVLPGSASVLGLVNDKNHQVTLLIDQDLQLEKFIGCHPCVSTSSLKISYTDLIEQILPSLHHTPHFVVLKGIVEDDQQ